MKTARGWLVAVALLALSGCSKKVAEEAAAVAGETAKPESALAYEHTVSIALPNDLLSTRMQAVREACAAETHGPCRLLQFELRTGAWPAGTVQVRIAPAAVEPMVAQAAVDGQTGSRSTRAEDLAPLVADNTLERERLARQREALEGPVSQGPLSVSDRIALSGELARIDTQLAALERDAAKLDHRIETNLLTLQFQGQDAGSWSVVGEAFDDVPERLSEGISEAIGWLALLLPFALVAFPFALGWRGLWRWATRPRRAG